MKVKPRSCNQHELDSLYVSKGKYIKSVERKKRQAMVKLHKKRKRLLSQSEIVLLNGRECEVVLKDVMLSSNHISNKDTESVTCSIIPSESVKAAYQIYEAEQLDTGIEDKATKNSTKLHKLKSPKKVVKKHVKPTFKKNNASNSKLITAKIKKITAQQMGYSFQISPTLNLLSTEHNQDCNFTVIKVAADMSEAIMIVNSSCKKLNLLGLAEIELICGQITVHGHTLKQGVPTNIYSPVTHALLTFEIGEPCKFFCPNDSLKKRYEKDVLKDFDRFVENHVAIFVIKDIEHNTLPGFASIYNPSSNFCRPTCFISKQRILSKLWVVETDGCFQKLKSHESFIKEVLDAVLQKETYPIILTAGSKNTGKSTFNRYLVNSLLSQVKYVNYMECDVGQSEFTPSGIVSINKITNPLLGPPYTHCHSPEYACFYGYNFVGDFPDEYIGCATKVFSKHDSRMAPLVVNTLGWNKGLGVHLLTDIIKIVKPSHIVQLETDFPNRNLPILSNEFINAHPGWKINEPSGNFHKLTLMHVPSYTGNNSTMISAADLRQIMMLAYLDDFVSTPYPVANLGQRTSLVKKLCQKKPYKISVDDIEIWCLTAIVGNLSQNELFAVLNCSLVGLCIKNSAEAEVVECLGLGLVKGVKPMQRQLYILSKLNMTEIQRVNCLVHAGISLPKHLLLQQKNVNNSTSLPYCTLDTSKAILGASRFKVHRNFQQLSDITV